MASVRDNTDFIYQTPDIVNPNFESSKHTHNIVHIAELSGLGVGYITNAALFIRGASLGLPQDRSLKNLWAHRSRMWQGGSEYIEHLNMLPAGISALTAGGIALAYGRNWEEKLQGASLGAAEFTAERIAQHLGTKIIEAHFADFESKGVLNKNSLKWLAREGGGFIIGAALIPVFNYTFKNIGKLIDEATSQSSNDQPELNSPHHPHIKRKRKMIDGNDRLKGKLKTKTNIDDENPSRRNVEESIARRIVHGHAF